MVTSEAPARPAFARPSPGGGAMPMSADHSAPNSLPIDAIRASAANPRKVFDPDALAELAESIREHGIIEPLVVRRDGAGAYELIAGERRLRAAALAGLDAVPIRVLDVDEREAAKLRLVENLQRVDLDPIEEAEGYRALRETLGMKQTEIAKAVHRTQPMIANSLRLLALPEDVRELIRSGQLTRSHGVELCRWAAFPAVCSIIAKRAVESRWTTDDTARGLMAVSYDLERAGAAVRLYHDKPAACEACPFDAYRAESFGLALCLKPEHYRELEAAAQAEVRAKIEERRAAVQATSADGERVAVKDDLAPGSFAYLPSDPERLPAGCTLDCPCRTRVVREDGVDDFVCTDKARHLALEVAHAKAEARRKKASEKRDRERVSADVDRIAGPSYVGARELVTLATAALARVRHAPSFKAAVRRHAPGLAAELPESTYLGSIGPELLAKLAPSDAVKLALDAVLGNDLHDHYSGYQRSRGLAGYYLDGDGDGHGDSHQG